MLRRFVFILAGVTAAFGQSFEAASIKPNKSGSNQSFTNTTIAGLTAQNVSLKQLIVRAYNIADYAVSGPAWLGDDKFDVVAKQPPGAPKGQMRLMQQSLLVERFRLVVHHESKSLRGYVLVAGKKPPKSHEKPAGVGSNTSSSRGKLKGTNVSMAELADMLARQLDQPVQDQTRLAGVFDVSLEWNPDQTQPDDRVFSILTAVEEQLGLKLQPQKVSVDVLVVDHAERIPSEN